MNGDWLKEDITEIRTDQKKILEKLNNMEGRVTVLEAKNSDKRSIAKYLFVGFRGIAQMVVGGSILYMITTFLMK